MLKIVNKMVLLMLITTACICAIILFDRFVIGGQYQNNYQASLIDKVNRLKSISDPKIILVGNSNLSFGMNSETVEKQIGMPVVNLGLHGALGNAYHEQIAKLNISEGDIVVICHSTYSDKDEISDPELAWISYDYNDFLWPIIRKRDYKAVLLAYPTYLRKSYFLWITRQGNLDSGDCYSRNAFNEYGDIVYKPVEEQMEVDAFFKKAHISVPEINDICVDRINELNVYCKEKGAVLVVAGYPIAYGKYSEFTEKDFKEFQARLEKVLDCEVISNYTDYFYPYDYFYNTNLHLNDRGTEKRTEQLILDLKKWMTGKDEEERAIVRARSIGTALGSG